MNEKKIKVLIVDDSSSVLDLLSYILGSDPQIEVVGTATNGSRALAMLEKLKPDVIAMDIDMPVMDGIETTRTIMETQPIPIIIVTASYSRSETEKTFLALDAGALSIMAKPRGMGHPDHAKMADTLVKAVKTYSEIKLVKRRRRPEAPINHVHHDFEEAIHGDDIPELVVIGASTGGPPAIQLILRNLPSNLPAPILIVQHIAEGFLESFRDWLVKTTGQQVHIAGNGERAIAGHCYLAPDHMQMGVNRSGRMELSCNNQMYTICPSVSYLFGSAANSYGRKVIGILLTGMGKDGAAELKLLREKGAVTIAQDKESSVIYGMPGEAQKIGAAKYILPPPGIAAAVARLLKRELV
ncbi:MAG: chemotaxis-specific protein-glutamate methyltransferase CheB [Bacteroidota bacterium]